MNGSYMNVTSRSIAQNAFVIEVLWVIIITKRLDYITASLGIIGMQLFLIVD